MLQESYTTLVSMKILLRSRNVFVLLFTIALYKMRALGSLVSQTVMNCFTGMRNFTSGSVI